jgi:hypothetical protein
VKAGKEISLINPLSLPINILLLREERQKNIISAEIKESSLLWESDGLTNKEIGHM